MARRPRAGRRAARRAALSRRRRAGRGERRWRPVWALLVVYGLGIALAAVQLLPARDVVRLSRRSGAVSLVEFPALPAARTSSPAWCCRGFRVPDASVLRSGGVFVGTLTGVLALAGARSRRREQVFLTAAFVVTLLLALRPFTPLGEPSSRVRD